MQVAFISYWWDGTLNDTRYAPHGSVLPMEPIVTVALCLQIDFTRDIRGMSMVVCTVLEERGSGGKKIRQKHKTRLNGSCANIYSPRWIIIMKVKYLSIYFNPFKAMNSDLYSQKCTCYESSSTILDFS